MNPRWLLPEQMEDLLPAEAWQLEAARSRLLALFRGHGYELVVPPALEYMESLLTGSGEHADLVTFKVVDQLSGRLLGLRADITPQVARIDAHRLAGEGVRRLCYAGSTYRARSGDAGASREPFQIGAELYGHAGLAADLEVQGLLIAALAVLDVHDYVLDLGHVGIFAALVEGLPAALEDALLDAMQGKNTPRVEELTVDLPEARRSALRARPSLCGGSEMIALARQRLPALPGITAALAQLEAAAASLAGQSRLEIDLAELRGYAYHSGMVFAVYAPGYPGSVARGGRYDAIGEAFGRSRPATGFSIDLRDLLPRLTMPAAPGVAWLPASAAAAFGAGELAAQLARHRAAGLVVIRELEGGDGRIDPRCDRHLVASGGALREQPIESNSIQGSTRP
ncbi:MAG: ATP phosphoribosyltransferase regulatory subunit [Pseudomonadota bacterium]|nr:ATP phosphoribosyltransferase regulatory subunit [Pseudomonadota bacterium]